MADASPLALPCTKCGGTAAVVQAQLPPAIAAAIPSLMRAVSLTGLVPFAAASKIASAPDPLRAVPAADLSDALALVCGGCA